MVDLSVVVPVYGCAACLEALHRRLTAALAGAVPSYEIVLVDDCAPDDAWNVIARLARADSRVRGIRLSRNFGQHAAITAGLAECKGRRALVMDCDLQDPPELIPQLYQKALAGHDIVLARRKRKRHSVFRRLAAALYFRLLGVLSNRRFDGEFGAFSIVSRPVIDAFLRFQDRDRHYLFILYWLGFDAAAVEYEHADRHSGTSAYSLRALLSHAFGGIMFQTTRVLRWIVYFGFAVSAAGALLAGCLVYLWFTRTPPPGWTSLAVLVLVIGGFIIMSTGITGLYIGKIFEQVKGRPLYVIGRRISGEINDERRSA
jgi:glycosyltransferase involved in cell wall biosynthesis